MAEQYPNRSDQSVDFADEPRRAHISIEAIWRETSLLAKILVPLAIAAVVVTAAFFGGTGAVVGTFTAFMLMLFISLPLWLACMEDDHDEHEHPANRTASVEQNA